MPFISASFVNPDGTSDQQRLLREGPTLQVTVSTYPSPADPAEMKSKVVWALVDTGASNCMIDKKLAVELGLIEIDRMIVFGVSGPVEQPVYMGAILVPHLENHQYGRFLAADLNADGQAHDVLLGRDFLVNTMMIYDGFRGQVTIGT